MATTRPVADETEEDDPDVLDAMVERGRHVGERDEARLAEYGTPVWALIAYLNGPDGGIARTAAAYHLPEIAVRAAIHYYERNRPFIDARLLLNSEANDF